MVYTWLIIAFFVALGVGVVLAAMSGGPAGARKALQTRSRTGGRVVAGVIGAIALIGGAVVPALVMVGNASGRAEKAPGGVRLTAAEVEGREHFKDRCSQCHTLRAANAVGRVGPNLDELRPPKQLTIDAILKGRARGQNLMPPGLYDGEDAEEVAAFVARTAGR